MANDKTLRWSRRLSVVPRWGVVPTIRKQNVAEHSYHVTMLCLWLTEFIADGDNDAFKYRFMCCALGHDIQEAADGDAPSPSRPPTDYSKLTPEQLVTKVADLLEAYLFMHEEVNMGNAHNAKPVMDYLVKKLQAVAEFVEFRESFVQDAEKEWRKFLQWEEVKGNTGTQALHKVSAKKCAITEIIKRACDAVFRATSVHPGMESDR